MNKTNTLKNDLNSLQAFRSMLEHNKHAFNPMSMSPVSTFMQTFLQQEIDKCSRRIVNINKLLEEKKNDQ